MHAETNLLPSEPATHTQNSYNCSEWSGCEDNRLNNEELQRFHTLKAEANILFDQQPRWDLVTSLYSEYFQEPGQKSGKEWMRLGFQGQYPETDFRGGGVLSLQLILRFVKRNRALVQTMEHDKAGFFFAITAINIAFFLKKYFHLADFLVVGKDEEVYCSRRALKNFCRLLLHDEQAYANIHEDMLKFFYSRLWLPEQQNNAQTLLKFNSLFQQLTSRLKTAFQGRLETIVDFKTAFGE